MRFDNQSALITGGVTGLGRAYVLALAERGARVFLVDILPKTSTEVHDLLRALSAMGACASYLQADVGVKDDVDSILGWLAKQGGVIDLLVNNAGVYVQGPLTTLSDADFERQWQVDVAASIALTRALWPSMITRGYGRVVMTTAVSALYGDLHQSAYASAKMGLLGLVNGLAAEGAEFNVRINSLCPLAHTAMTKQHLATQVKPLFSKEIVTATLLFLLSSKAPYGRHLLAAGGSVSELCIAEHQHKYFNAEHRTPEAIASAWRVIDGNKPINKFTNGEAQILAFAKRAAAEQDVVLD